MAYVIYLSFFALKSAMNRYNIVKVVKYIWFIKKKRRMQKLPASFFTCANHLSVDY